MGLQLLGHLGVAGGEVAGLHAPGQNLFQGGIADGAGLHLVQNGLDFFPALGREGRDEDSLCADAHALAVSRGEGV